MHTDKPNSLQASHGAGVSCADDLVSHNETIRSDRASGRAIAIVGGGQVGLLTAHALVELGYRVTVYSERTAEDWLYRSSPGGAVVRFGDALDWERELGVAYWEKAAPSIGGAHVTVCPKIGNRLATLAGRFDRPSQAIDLRLQCHRWMNELEARGGTIVIDRVTVARLDEIAAENDLTIVAAGRGAIGELFERDAARSTYSEPQRHLATAIVAGIAPVVPGVPFLPIKINLLGPLGECVFAPYFHRDLGPAWNVLIEAKPGTPFDRFANARSAGDVVAWAKEMIREFLPWEASFVKDMEPADENGWLIGRVTPTVRSAVGRLPSGRMVMPLGDTAMSLDPIGGQGANNGYRMARNLIRHIVTHEDRPFDAEWMQNSFDSFYRAHGQVTDLFNNTLLGPMTPAGQELLIAQYGSDGTDHGDLGRQAIADAFVQGFADPRSLTPLLHDRDAARRFIAEHTHRPWWYAGIRGRLGIARGQLRQALGASPGHPFAGPDPAHPKATMHSNIVTT